MRSIGMLLAVLFLVGGMGMLMGAQEPPRIDAPSSESETSDEYEGFLARPLGYEQGSLQEQYTRSKVVAYLERIEREAPCIWPTDDRRVISPFGKWRYWSQRTDIIEALRKDYPHMGMDIAGRIGDPVYAACHGVVTHAGWKSGYGWTTEITDRRGETLLYGHKSKILVKLGERVKKGDRIGDVGNTGSSLAPHLHVTRIVEGKPADPCDTLPCEYRMDAIADSQ